MLSSTQGRLIQPSEEGRQPSRQQGKCERALRGKKAGFSSGMN